MIPVLFKEDETVFNHNGIGALYESLSCIVYEEENGQYSLELEYPVDGEWFKEIKDLRIIQAKPNDIDEPHNFTIYEIDKSLDELTVYVRAETSTNNELRSNLISAYIGSNVTPQQAMNGLKSNLLESTNLTFYSDIQTRSNVEWVRINPLSALVGIRGSMVDIWGGEMKRSNNTIYFYSRRGRDKIATVRVGKNIEGLRSTVSTAGLITKILPHYTYTPVEIPKYEIVTYQDGRKEKRRVSNTGQYVGGEVTVLGNHVSSQYVNNYPRVYWADVDYGDDQELNELVRNFIDTRMQQAEDSPTVINNNNFPTELKNFIKTELDKRSKLYFTDRNPGVDQPTVRMTVDLLQLADSPEWEAFARLEQIGLTDTVEVYVPKFDMDIEVRITGLTYDSLAEQTISIDAGSRATPRMTTIEREYADTTKKLKDHINTIENGVQNVVMNSADGSVRKFHGYTMPDDSISSVGDMWFKDIGEGKTEIWIYDGVYWQVQMNEDFALDIIEHVEKVERESEESLEKINQINKDIEDAILEAGFTTLPEALSEIQDKMDTARFDQEIVSIVNDIADAKTEASQALIEAQKKVNTSDFDNAVGIINTGIQDAMDDAAEALGEARKKVDSLEFDDVIESLVGDIQESKDSAAQALTEAQKKVNTIDFDNIVNDIETGVQDAMDEAELATNTLRDSTGQLIKSQDLKVNIDGITSSLTSYAKTTDLNGLATETFVTNKGYQTASQINTTLASYAKTTDLNGLVSQTWVENKGYATASEVSSELSAYAKSSDLTGLATESYVTTRGYQTASQISTTLSAYEKTSTLNTKLAGKANVGDIPSLVGYAKESWVENKSYATAASVATSLKAYEKITDVDAKLADKADLDDIPNITGLASETWVENKSYATAESVTNQLSSYAKSSDLNGLATETFVTNKGYQTAAQITTTLSAYEKTSTLNTKLAGKANVGDIPSLTGYAKESWVENKSYATAASVATSLTAYEKTTDVNAKLADKADLDDIAGLASETWVENKSYATAASVTTQLSSYAKSSDLNGLATETFVTNKGYQTAAQVSTTLSSYAKTSQLTGLATETYVTTRGYQTASQISTTLTAYEKTAAVNTKLAGKANVGDIPSLTGYAKESWVENKSYATAASVTTSLKAYEKITDVDAKLANKANSSDIPSLTGYAKESWVENKSYATAASVATSLTAYEKTAAVNTKLAGKANVGDIPSIAGLASETWVENKSYATAASVTTQLSSYARTSDLNGLATETFVTNKGYQTAAQVTTTLSSYAKTSQLTGLATETFVTSKGYQTASQVSTTLSSYAKTTDLSGLATQTYVTSRGYQTASQITTTLAAYAKTSQLSGLATETFVTNKGYQTASQVSTTLSSYVKTSTLSGYATVATVNAIKSTADTNKATISTNTGKISTIEQTVGGLQTTVASKAAQSQVTQLSNSLTSTIRSLSIVDMMQGRGKVFKNPASRRFTESSLTGTLRINTPLNAANMTRVTIKGYNYTASGSDLDLTVSFYRYTGTQLRSHSYTSKGTMSVSNVRLGFDSSGRAVILVDVSGSWSYPHIIVEEVIVGHGSQPDTYQNGWSISIGAVSGVSSIHTVSVGMDTQSRITQNATNINLRVQKNDVINQINISTEGILIGSAKNKLNITATTTYIANATIKTAHIADLSVSNAKIANGTIASAKIANLDVAKLNGNITTFMRSSWNSATGGSVTIAGSGIQSAFNYAYDGAITNSGNMVIANGIIAVSGTFSHSHGSTYMKINADSIYGENLLSNGTVRSLFSINGDGIRVNKLGNQASFEYDRVIFRQFAGIRYYDANARIEIQSYNGVALGSSQTNGVFLPRLTVGGGASGILPFIDAHVRMNMQDVLNMGNNELMNAYSITGVNNVLFGNTSNRLVLSANGALNILSPVQTQIGHYAGGAITNVLIVSANYVNIYKPMSMNGNAITNQSDGRKKDFISDATINSLSAIESWRFVGFNYKKGLNYAEGRQFGLIAQDTPDLALYDSVQDNWSINSSKQIMMNSHAIQQLVKRESNTNLLASNAYLKAESNEDKIKRLEDRIEELEGVM